MCATFPIVLFPGGKVGGASSAELRPQASHAESHRSEATDLWKGNNIENGDAMIDNSAPECVIWKGSREIEI